MPHLMTVTTSGGALRLRSSPEIRPDNTIAMLPAGRTVERMGPDAQGFSRVRAIIDAASIEGFASSAYLTSVQLLTAGIPAVHWGEGRPSVNPDSTQRACPIGDSGAPRRTTSNPPERCEQINAIIAYLRVETAPRYRPCEVTFCNVYAHDYCYLAGAYLPRVWWNNQSVALWRQGRSVIPSYDSTLVEMRANALLGWLEEFGPGFGWRAAASLADSQREANRGGVAVICAKRHSNGPPGHITVVVPESAPPRTAKTDQTGQVLVPLQSQAGQENHAYWSGHAWWEAAQFARWRAFLHD